MQQVRPFPRRLVFGSSALQDALLTTVGIMALVNPPRALRDVGAYGEAGAVWALMLIIGAVLAFWGGLRDYRTIEVVGCFVLAGGFFVWSFAVVSLDSGELLFWQYGLGLAAAGLGQLRRGGLVASGLLRYLRPEHMFPKG